MTPTMPRRAAHALLVVFCACGLAFFTTGQYIAQLGFDYLDQGNQLRRHLAILKGHAGDPWQYRVLSAYLVRYAIRLCEWLALPRPLAHAFWLFRMALDAGVLVLAYAYYRALDLRAPAALLGMMLLAWAMSYSHYDSDLQFSTFLDVMAYLAMALLLLRGGWRWLPALTLFAALNRETSGLLPLLPLVTAACLRLPADWRTVLPTVLASGVLWLAVFVGLRHGYGEQQVLTPYGHQPGLDMLAYNFGRTVTWVQMLATLGLVPLVALLGYRAWPPFLKVLCWALVPAWFVIHAWAAVLAETRLLLVPQALVFVPAALVACGALAGRGGRAAD